MVAKSYKMDQVERNGDAYGNEHSDGSSSPKRRRSRSRSRDRSSKRHKEKRHRRRHRPRGRSESSASPSSSDSSASSRSRNRQRHHKSHKRDSSSRRHDRRHKEKKSTGSSRKRESKVQSSKQTWGAYGILQECDMWNKRPEFQLWLMEIKNVTLELLPAWEEKALFREFMEDYNTATLAHEKYYNLEKWERKQSDASKNDNRAESSSSVQYFNDEEKRRLEIQALREHRRKAEVSSAYEDIRQDVEKVKAMRHQQLLQTQMKTLFRMGRVEEAQKIRDRLKPDEE